MGVLRWIEGQVGPVRAYRPRAAKSLWPKLRGGREVVVLVRGLIQSHAVLELLAERLDHSGYDVWVFQEAGFLSTYNTLAIEHLAQALQRDISHLRERLGVRRVNVVGHSKGGLVARHYLQALGGEREVKHLITLGTPHRGTAMAWVAALPPLGWVLQSGRQLLPESSFLEALNRLPMPTAVRMTSIYSRADIVCPHRRSILAPRPGVENIEVGGVGHSDLLRDMGVFDVILRALVDSVR